MSVLRSVFTLDADSGMSDRDRITLSPIEKWRQYKRFPFKLVVHAMLLALTTLQIFVVVTQFTSFARGNEMIFAQEFLEPDEDTLTDELYSVDDFLHRVNHIVETYYNFDDGTITKFVLDRDQKTGIIEPITLTLHQRPFTAVDNAMIEISTYSLTAEDPLGPFNTSLAKLKSMLSSTAALEFSFDLSSVVPSQFLTAPFRWSINIHFKNVGGIFLGQVGSTRRIENQSMLYKLGWMPVALILVAAVSLSLQVKATIASIQIYLRTRSAFRSIPKEKLKEVYENLWLPGVIPIFDWKDVPFGVKLDFFGSWYGLEIMGEVFILIACFHGLIQDLGLPISDFSRVFLGTGFLIICLGFAKYLEYWKKFYMLVITMQGSFQRNLRFVISVLPLYMGFCTCGFIIFSPYTDDFSSLDKSAITLFALLNGDDIHSQFDRIYARYPYPIVGQVFLFTFIIMFITLVLNIFLFIIEDAYHAAKDFINTKAERHSRVHRRKDAGRDGGGVMPRLGDVEFDLPTLFDVIEEAVEHIPKERKRHIRKRDPSKLSSVALSMASPSINGDPVDPAFGAYSLSEFGAGLAGSILAPGRAAIGAHLSSTFGGQPHGHDWGGRDGTSPSGPALRSTPSGGLARTRSSALSPRNGNGQDRPSRTTSAVTFAPLPDASSSSMDLDTGSATSSFVPAGSKVVPAPARTTGTTPTAGAKKQFKVHSFGTPGASTAAGGTEAPALGAENLQLAIATTIAHSQAEFLQEVDEKMRTMRERFAAKLQADLEALLSPAPKSSMDASHSTESQAETQEREPSTSTEPTSPSRTAIPSFLDDDDE